MADTSQLFGLLANVHRRRILVLLCQTDSVRVPEGIRTRSASSGREQDVVHRSGNDRSPADSSTSTRESDALELQLRHGHLPKLEDEEVIEWDRQTNTVSRGPKFAEVEPALRVLVENAASFPEGLR